MLLSTLSGLLPGPMQPVETTIPNGTSVKMRYTQLFLLFALLNDYNKSHRFDKAS